MNDLKLRYLVLEQGRDNRQWFRSVNPDTGATYDLEAAGYNDARLQVRNLVAEDEDSVVLLDLSLGSGEINIDYVADDGAGNSWSGYLYVPASATSSIDSVWEDAIYDFVLIHSGGSIDTFSRGPAMLIPMVTVV